MELPKTCRPFNKSVRHHQGPYRIFKVRDLTSRPPQCMGGIPRLVLAAPAPPSH